MLLAALSVPHPPVVLVREPEQLTVPQAQEPELRQEEALRRGVASHRARRVRRAVRSPDALLVARLMMPEAGSQLEEPHLALAEEVVLSLEQPEAAPQRVAEAAVQFEVPRQVVPQQAEEAAEL